MALELPIKVHVLVRCDGEYEEREETPVRAFTNQEEAEEHFEKLSRVANVRSALTMPRDTLRRAVVAEYKKLGYEGDEQSTWHLAECPLNLVLPMQVMQRFYKKKKKKG